MDPNEGNLHRIFSGSQRLEVPFFQRSYVWGEMQWERLLEDAEFVSANKESYFMGSLILKQKPTSSGSRVGDVRLLIDGQQRLTTLSILMKVLCLKANDPYFFKRKFILLDEKPAILHSHNDEAAYNRIMALDTLDELEGTDSVTKAYNYFREHIDADKLKIENIFSFIYFVVIDLRPNQDEQQIFDTINSLGVRLTTAELLKNYFFGRDDVTIYRENWLNIFERDSETKAYWDREITTGGVCRTYIDILFYSYLMIKIQDNSVYIVSSADKDRFTKVERLFDSYKAFIEKYIDGDKLALIREIKEYALTFCKVISSDILAEELPASSGVQRINAIMFSLGITTLIPFVLFVEKNNPNESERNELYDYLEAYLMRRVVTRKSTNNYNSLFSEQLIFNRVLTKEQLIQAISNREDTTNRMPTDEEVRVAFHEEHLTNKYSAGVLYMIESKIRNRVKHATALLGINKYSLEHIMPKKWRNHWDLGLTADENTRDKVLLTLGNLTIITQSLNASIRDADWVTKKEGKGDKGGLRKYSEGIETLFGYLDKDKWDEDAIKERANYLADKALEVWNIRT